MVRTLALTLAAAFTFTPTLTTAQTPDDERRGVVFADLGYGRILDDEGILGNGPRISGGAGFRLTSSMTIQAIIDRISYHRDVEWLTFDGRVYFVGAEAAFQATRPRIRSYATIGVGFFDDRGTWIHKTRIGPTQTVADPPTDRKFTLAATTASGGIDVRVSERASVRIGVRLHGLLDTGDDLAPHTIFSPGIGAAWRW